MALNDWCTSVCHSATFLTQCRKFAFDANGEFIPEATTFLMTGENLSYLLCVLNSPLSEWFFSKVGTTTGVGTVRWKKFTIQELMIPNVDDNGLQKFQYLIESYNKYNLSYSYLTAEANRIIYDIVGLTSEEICYVENFYPPIS